MAGSKNRVVIPYEESHKIIDGIEYKLCNKCFNWFPCNSEYFYKTNSKTKDGLFPNCIACNRKATLKWKEDNRQKYDENMKKHYRSETYRKRKQRQNQEQRDKGNRYLWEKANPDKIKQYSEKYSNKKHNIRKQEWIACKDYFKNEDEEWSCAYCGLPISQHFKKFKGVLMNMDFHKEHVDHNGEGDLYNCVPSCHLCNSSKHQYKLDEWYPKQEFYSEEKYLKIQKWTMEDYKLYINN